MKKIIWVLVSIVAAFCMGVIALNKGESINAAWIVIASICIYTLGYRFYALFIEQKLCSIDANRITPAVAINDGKDFVPTNKYVLFGHHFAAIAGAGPLVGPILAAQMGYLPSVLWILIGGVFVGATHDFVVLFVSSRRGAKSLGEMIKDEMGSVVGSISMLGVFLIMLIIIAILAMVVVKALAHSPWGTFTIFCTIPIAIFMGIYMRYLRPANVLEASIIGFVLLLLALYFGKDIAQNPSLARYFDFSVLELSFIMMAYGIIASILPVWFLLAPRDYLSTFLKIGVIVAMALCVIFALPDIKMAKITHFIDGTGPVFAGGLFPFLFINIACGAISGFHALISSGTSPKMLESEKEAKMVGYGSMLMESAVAIMALIAACILEPGIYFAINSAPAIIGNSVESAASIISSWGFSISPSDINALAKDIGENTILSRTGGAPTFAIGLSLIIHEIIGGKEMMAFWYHFAILFEALFILTAVDAGTRTCRFMVQDMLGNVYKPLANTANFAANLFATLLCVAGWGWFLYGGAIDPLGGIYSLWSLFGVSNQLLAVIAMFLCASVFVKMNKRKYILAIILPALFVISTTFSAGVAKILPMSDDKIANSISHVATAQINYAKANNLKDKIVDEKSKKEYDKAIQVANSNVINAILTVFFLLVTIIVGIKFCVILRQSYKGSFDIPLKEVIYEKAAS
ncbi:carbon starvation CstA family protein [Campylobacter canadensis]|uniref:Carbon starvation protein A n=1 Tax=Campylobacter canadensis TaxID=449520 RepID=A0ABS7WSG4_9BACT|nr:carbon starvation CstA family protein [Campylobacter canadensis]MBZ7987706.1 carbon starvation protein A [Campylobacter canadensis]MBZ7995884.1 carbon starvation protein A [Campylobacter canadensis]MBZ7997521.1 carbon starvation protein A [Campylobacter canadensis]MBZ7999444.1 carbon starvation protein A [Campylobacter canadensis]MBZ8001241.1 carbon starvation protein A [Campylobacter canadensis]